MTIRTRDGQPADIVAGGDGPAAIRAGVVYVPAEGLGVGIPAGDYELWATRGMEWSLGQRAVAVRDAAVDVELELRREVDTSGYIAVDTHVHTLAHSGHGDATVAERVLTLAGEGVELAVATDHDHGTDYVEPQQRAALGEDFVSVIGSEVTMPYGHVNAFPLPAGVVAPALADVDALRAHGALVTILNHPRWPRSDGRVSPFVQSELDPLTGWRRSGGPLPFDALEVLNASDEQEDPLLLFHDWFGLLNRGERLAAVGSSDSHSVADPVGQGRTYVRSSTDDPAHVDVGEICAHLAQGRGSVSLGCFVDVTLDGRWKPGDVAAVGDSRSGAGDVDVGIDVELRIAAPSWVRPRSAWVFVDGQAVLHADVPAESGALTDVSLTLRARVPEHDAWLVCVVIGDAVQGPYWPSVNRYTLAATNPVFIDRDGDGAYDSPRATALARLQQRRSSLQPLDDPSALHGLDEGAALQYLELLSDEASLSAARTAASLRSHTSGPITTLLSTLPARSR